MAEPCLEQDVSLSPAAELAGEPGHRVWGPPPALRTVKKPHKKLVLLLPLLEGSTRAGTAARGPRAKTRNVAASAPRRVVSAHSIKSKHLHFPLFGVQEGRREPAWAHPDPDSFHWRCEGWLWDPSGQ